MDAIDGMLRELHALRSRLVGEIRESDDIGAARAAAALRTGWGRGFFKHRLSHVPVVYRPREGRLARPGDLYANGRASKQEARPGQRERWTGQNNRYLDRESWPP